jgi:Family of unknown function (DUF5752)
MKNHQDGLTPMAAAENGGNGEKCGNGNATSQLFNIKDCALIAIATGRRAQNLREMRDILQTIDDGSIYYHFWGSRLQPNFDDPEYQNDFAAWAHHSLRDGKAAEQLGSLDPTDFNTTNDLRQELIEVIEERLAEEEHVSSVQYDLQFNFMTSQIVVFDTHKSITRPEELLATVPNMSLSSLFYHLIDARRRTVDSSDDFRAWLSGYGSQFADEYVELSQAIADLDPFFSTLQELRSELTDILSGYFRKGK